MQKFKAGQEVICVKAYDYTHTKTITIGSIFTIYCVDVDDTLHFVDRGWWHNPENFVPLTPAAVLLYKNLPTGHKLVDTP